MNKSVTKIGCLLLSATMVTSLLASCGGGKKQTYDTETRPLVFSTDALDGNFNPFFATSATDSTIAAITQVGMLTTDADGSPKCGDDVPTVALDYTTTYYDENGQKTQNSAKAADGGSTVYEFAIKNGMKFSDGEPLTIKDVLFNLYVYLDPMYMGSATIYSTDIKGLMAYRMQDPDASDDTVEQDSTFEANAEQRMNNLLDYLENSKTKTEQISKDIETTKKLFREFLEADWTMYSGAYESYKDDYNFTEGWEIFYFNEGIIDYQTDSNGPKKENGKYLTTLDPNEYGVVENAYRENIENVKAGNNPDYPLQTYIDEQGCTIAEAGEYAVRDYAIDTVYDTYTSEGTLETAVWSVYNDLYNSFVASEKSAWVEEQKAKNEGKLLVETVSGITTYRTKNFNGKNLGENHDVLKIEINGVDPKAIWNFAFSVAPMHYYSGDYVNEKGETVTTLTDAKNDQGTATVKDGNGNVIAENQYVNFGVNFNNKEFFETVLRNTDKNGLPVGAGVYKASNEKPTENETTRRNFYRNNWVYFERNTEFDSMGGKNVYDAKIKYMRYRVVSSNNILQALEAKNIDFGAPQATQDNITAVGNVKHLDYRKYRTNGYGYVGINPKFIPDLEVRQAIMMAMDTVSIVPNYYKNEDLAEPIFRSMSKESWAYPDGAVARYPLTREAADIRSLVESAGWTEGSDGIYEKDGKKLNITFTIAGESTDHPAHDMFQDAKDFLETCGFKISVITDINALKNLANGNLAVWAAAWNSTIDPDLYQVYHKDSKATSVQNWGYDVIYEDTKKYAREAAIIDELSELIEAGRKTLELKGENGREAIYAEALDLIMELAVELPTYQRSELVVYNTTVIDASTLNKNPTANAGVYDELWKVNYR